VIQSLTASDDAPVTSSDSEREGSYRSRNGVGVNYAGRTGANGHDSDWDR
jgi:hypothetical protein